MNDFNPLVSILIPTYNQDLTHLQLCIESATNQTYQNSEIIVSDNHSDNGTADFLRSYAGQIKVVRPHTFLSMAENFDFCANSAEGEYYSFLSSDDELLPTAIEKLVASIQDKPNIAFACGNIIYDYDMPAMPQSSKKAIRPLGHQSTVYSRQAAMQFFFPWTKKSTWMAGDLINANLYRRIGGFSKCEYLIAGDYWITHKLLELGDFVCLDEPLALFRMKKIGHKEADRDRRLLEFADRELISQNSRTRQSGSLLKNAYNCLRLIEILGEQPRPSNSAITKANTVFVECKQIHLSKIITEFIARERLYIMLSKSLRLIRDVKNRLVRFKQGLD